MLVFLFIIHDTDGVLAIPLASGHSYTPNKKSQQYVDETTNNSCPKSSATAFQVLVGLGAALLSDERHAHATAGGYRPVNLKKVMATLVVQRALKRNMNEKRGKFNIADIVVAAEGNRDHHQPVSSIGLFNLNRRVAEGYHRGSALGDTGRLSSTGRLSTTGLGGLEGQDQQALPPVVTRGRAGSVILPPDKDESMWLLQRFLVDLQQSNDRNEEAGGEMLPASSRRSSVTVAGNRRNSAQHVPRAEGNIAGASGGTRGVGNRATGLELQNFGRGSRSSEARTEIGSPAARGLDRRTDSAGIDSYSEHALGHEEKGDGGWREEEKLEELQEVSAVSLGEWLRARNSVDP